MLSRAQPGRATVAVNEEGSLMGMDLLPHSIPHRPTSAGGGGGGSVRHSQSGARSSEQYEIQRLRTALHEAEARLEEARATHEAVPALRP